MDLNSRKSKVVRQKELNATGESSSASAVDSSLLDMLRSLQEAGSNQSFSDLLNSGLQKIGYDLRLAQHLIAKRDDKGLDQLAQDLAQNALKVGAVRLLSRAVDMQGMARIGDFEGVAELVAGLEEELKTVEKQLV